MSTELKDLVMDRGLLKASLTRFKKFFRDSVDSVTVKALQKRLEANLSLYESFNVVQTKIERLVAGTESEATHADEREAFETIYFNLIAEVESYIESEQVEQNRLASSPVAGTSVAGRSASPEFAKPQFPVQLPTIRLPTFDGNYNDWIKFRDTFISLIHENGNISDVQKFHYLNSALKGPAARVIQSLGISELNYKLAWDALVSRYENSIALRKHHVNALLDLPVVQKQSQNALREFLDDANSHLVALRALGESTDSWDTLIIPILARKLDSVTFREWERRIVTSSERVTFIQFSSFLEERSLYLESIATGTQVSVQRVESQSTSGSRKPIRFTTHITSASVNCPFCKGNHFLNQCEKFKDLPIDKKTKIVQTSQSCYNCLQTGHRVQNCSRRHCKICGKKHHLLLHCNDIHSTKSISGNSESDKNDATSSCVANIASNSMEHTVLSTAVIYVEDNHGQKQKCRALLDSGSQANLITDDFYKRLGIKSIPVETKIAGIGRIPNSVMGKVELHIFSGCNSFRANISCLRIKNITVDMPNLPLSKSQILIPSKITLADPDFNNCKRIDMLIGAGLFWRLLCIGQHKAGPELIWQKTQFGWVLGGKFNWQGAETPGISRCHLVTNDDLQRQLESFWQVEEIRTNNNTEVDECEAHFLASTRRNSDGRYIVSIPFNDNLKKLGTSWKQAESRLLSLEKRLAKQPELREQYIQFMNEYELLGHMSCINTSKGETDLAFYLPHHAVYKESSTTTKVRVVFDGSAGSSTGISLNDTQRVGPTVQSDLHSILLRFRLYTYVLSADIAKMFRQILIEPEERRFQRILWRSSPELPIETFELNTVTYGTASAPYLATRVLYQIGKECSEKFPESSRIITDDFYVDDLLTGTDSISDARRLKEEITNILSQAGFQLRKWATNYSPIFQEDISITKDINGDKDPKTLGLQWSSTEDELQFCILTSTSKRVTKRVILSEIAKIFDPLGLIGPVITRAKLIMQQLWQVNSGWDESVSQGLYTQWMDYKDGLIHLSKVKIPRKVVVDKFNCLELHGFADASERAYGACVYLRSRAEASRWEAKLLCSKSRVAPLKSVSLPRLELCAAVLLARLMNKVKSALRLKIKVEQYWSDSTITLAWIQSDSNRWETFVANRVSEIHGLSQISDWRHVPSINNPADLISHGSDPISLQRNVLWWSGPSWLEKDSDCWPSTIIEATGLPEERKNKVALAASLETDYSIFTRFSEYSRLLRITAYCLKFISALRRDSKFKTNELPDKQSLTIEELQRAHDRLICLAQQEAFSDELSALENNHLIAKNSSLLTLAPFLDERGIIRVGGRLENAPIPYSKKHPIILPSKHPLTDLIISHEHNRLLHAGCQAVIASLRQRYWTIACKRNVKRIIRNCIRCFRVSPRTTEYFMGQLPSARVTPARPFTTCGVDYAGPFMTKERTRSKVSVKAYICIFVCFVTKAIHIELATDLSTDAFLNCFRRFIARRGRCQRIVSDNATNFVGAKNELQELRKLVLDKTHNVRVARFLGKEQIEWKFIPPQSPHFGGLWEGAVKSTKYHLRRVIGEQKLTFEELYTLLTQVESCLNSRPLSPLTSNPDDLDPLTPGHFLIGDALNALPDHNLKEININRLSRFQLIQQMFQHFWKRWQNEYIHQLQQRYKWTTTSLHHLKEGALVVVKEDNLPPLRWCLGRIIQLHHGKDGVTRVASIKTTDGIYKRPINKLCILPIEDNDIDK